MLKAIVTISVLLSSLKPAYAATGKFQSLDESCAAASSVLQEGDLVFLDIPVSIFRKVAESTKSWTSHVGVAFKNENGQWIIAESTFPRSKETPLRKFLKKSANYKFEIKRLNRSLEVSEVASMRAKATELLGRPYTFGFDFDSKNLFCSKFAYLVFQAVGVEIGQPQTFQDLLKENPSGSTAFWQWWFFGSIPWERRTVTPASQLNDLDLITVLQGF